MAYIPLLGQAGLVIIFGVYGLATILGVHRW